ncbi:hypothetical protein BO221_42725 [Archangium sp. Cb G35]|uniref:hypothetical protein n=1 Tax=Archangium sp. Cb G35 TaxID=1920190 RepID=UPI000935D43D|nr:hypothetical protein [Archangium sp. Cb G35]OJT18194.1 hypothetical protein BO221_42725 [Archangium sp. Cb G35]
MAIPPSLCLGTAANLLFGFRPGWDPSNGDSSPLYAPPRAPLETCDAAIVARADDGWGFPELTLHDDRESLVTALYDCRVIPIRREGQPFQLPSGELLLGDTDRGGVLAELGERLGIDLTGDRGYMLARLRRVTGRADHEVTVENNTVMFSRMRHLTREGRKAMLRLRPGRRRFAGAAYDSVVGGAQAARCLEFCREFGTHFVSSVTVGEILLQVFVYDRAAFAEVAAAARAVQDRGGSITGYEALDFAYYARPGAGAQAGRLVSHSRDPALAESCRLGLWHDERLGGDSLFTPFHRQPGRADELLSRFKRIVPVALELTSLDRFMEHFRALSFRRVLKGALFQKFGATIALPLPRLVERPWSEVFPDAANGPSSGSDPVLAAPVLDLSAGGRIVLPASPVTLAPQIIDAPRNTASAAILEVPGEGFDALVLTAEFMEGALVLVDGTGRREVVVDGLRYADGPPSPETGRRGVMSRGDLHTLAPEAPCRLIPLLERLLPTVAAAADMVEPEARDLLLAHLDRLARLSASAGQVAPVAVVARLLASVLADDDARRGGAPALCHADLRDDAAELINAATELEALLRHSRPRLRMLMRQALAADAGPAVRQVLAEAQRDEQAILASYRRRLEDIHGRMLVALGRSAAAEVRQAEQSLRQVLSALAAPSPWVAIIVQAFAGGAEPASAEPSAQGLPEAILRRHARKCQALVGLFDALDCLATDGSELALRQSAEALDAAQAGAGLPGKENWVEFGQAVGAVQATLPQPAAEALGLMVALGRDWLAARHRLAEAQVLALTARALEAADTRPVDADSAPARLAYEHSRILVVLAHLRRLQEAALGRAGERLAGGLSAMVWTVEAQGNELNERRDANVQRHD